MRGWTGLIIGLSLIFIGMVGLILVGPGFTGLPGDRDFRQRMPGMGPFLAQPAEFESNGQRIYFTATSESDTPITFTGGPHWLQVHGGSCVSCHGPERRGGIYVPMTNAVTPDIRFSVLTSEQESEDHPPYTVNLIKRAITQGLDPADDTLHWAMPRWSMSPEDLDDLVDYLKVLNGEGRED